MDHDAKDIINQADKDGNTALHQMAGNLWQLESGQNLTEVWRGHPHHEFERRDSAS